MDYTYDGLGRVTNLNDYNGNDIAYTYHPAYGKVSTITAPGGKVWRFYYDLLGRLVRFDVPNGMATRYTYDGFDRVLTIEHRNYLVPVERFTYTYDDAGNVLSESRRDGSRWANTYDARNRLTAADRYLPDGTLLAAYDFTYDAADNLLTQTTTRVGGAVHTNTFTYNDDNTLATVSAGGTTITYSYDDWGRISSRTDGTFSATYTYGEGMEPTGVTSDFPGVSNATYSYRGDGKRYDSNGGQYDWAPGGFPVGGDEGTQLYVPLNPGASQTTVLAALDGHNPAAGTANYFFHDQRGSVRQTYSAVESLLSEAEFEPFGSVLDHSGAPITMGYRGLLYDGDTREHYEAPQSTLASALPLSRAGLSACAPVARPNGLDKVMESFPRDLSCKQHACERVQSQSNGDSTCAKNSGLLSNGESKNRTNCVVGGTCGGTTCGEGSSLDMLVGKNGCDDIYQACLELRISKTLEKGIVGSPISFFSVHQGSTPESGNYPLAFRNISYVGSETSPAYTWTWQIFEGAVGQGQGPTGFGGGEFTPTLSLPANAAGQHYRISLTVAIPGPGSDTYESNLLVAGYPAADQFTAAARGPSPRTSSGRPIPDLGRASGGTRWPCEGRGCAPSGGACDHPSRRSGARKLG